jgi:hypothetical protein
MRFIYELEDRGDHIYFDYMLMILGEDVVFIWLNLRIIKGIYISDNYEYFSRLGFTFQDYLIYNLIGKFFWDIFVYF